MNRRSMISLLAFFGIGANSQRPLEGNVANLYPGIRRYSLGALSLIEDSVAREYSLTDEQRNDLDQVFIKERMRLIDTLSRVEFSRRPVDGAFQADFWRSNTRLLAILTPVQRKQWNIDMAEFLSDNRPVILER